MKIAVLADLHFGVRKNNAFFLRKQEEFFYNQFFPYLESNKIDTVWMLGDFFENRSNLDVKILHHVKKFLDEFQKRDIKIYSIIGNHDLYFKNNSSINSIDFVFKPYHNIITIPKYEVIQFDGLDVGFLSWITPDEKDELMGFINNTTCPILCAHLEINNFEITRGVVCNSGLNVELFDKFDKVFSGHFHIPSTNGKIYYLGNPYETNWGEYGYDKGFYIFDTQIQILSLIENPIKIYHSEIYSDSIKIDKINDSLYTDKFVRILIEDNTYNKNKFNLFIEKVGNLAYSVEVVENRELNQSLSLEETDLLTISTLDIINQFIDSQESIDRDQIKKYILDIYKEALENPNIVT